MRIRFIDYVGNPGGGITIGTRLAAALRGLHPEGDYEFVSYGPALWRYRRAFQENHLEFPLRALRPVRYGANAASSIAYRTGLTRRWPALVPYARWCFSVPARALADRDVVIFPWVHRHDLPDGAGARVIGVLMDTIGLQAQDDGRPDHAAMRTLEKIRLEQWMQSRHILTAISKTTVDNLARHWPEAARRVRVIPLVGKEPVAMRADFPEAWTWTRRPYILYPANFSPHKNHAALFQALASARTGYVLVLVGSDAEFHARGTVRQAMVRQAAERHGLQPGQDLIALGYVPEDLYALLLQRAQAVVIPSLMEGFGLPVDEGLRAGVPVLCSDIPVFREVVETAGSQVVWFDPNCPESLAAALRDLRVHYDRLKTQALNQAPRVRGRTWATVAAQYWELMSP